VSGWTPAPPKPLLHTQLSLEAEVGIGHIPPCTSHSKSTIYIITDATKIKAVLRCVNHNFSQLLLTYFNHILLPTDAVCWHFCWHFIGPLQNHCHVFAMPSKDIDQHFGSFDTKEDWTCRPQSI